MMMDDGKATSSNINREEALSPAARLFHAPRFNCYIIAIIGCNTPINPNVVKAGLEHTLLKHPRFSCKLVVDGNKYRRKQKWRQTEVNMEDHVIVPELDSNIDFPDRFVEDYVSNLTITPLDLSKPLWEIHLLNIKTSDAEAVGIFRIHHSMGDGASLISLLLACTRKTSDPEALPTIPAKNRAATSTNSKGFWWFLLAFWLFLRLIWNTLVDVLLFAATILFLKDMKTPIKGAPGVELNIKKFLHRTVSLDDIKLVKNAMNMTVNDVVVGVTQAGLSRYLNRRYGEEQKDGRVIKQRKTNIPKGTHFRATILVNLRKTVGIQDLADMMAKGSKTRWGNMIGYLLLPFNIALQEDPLNYVRQAKAAIDRKKLSREAIISYLCAELVLRTFGAKKMFIIREREFKEMLNTFINYAYMDIHQVAAAIAHRAIFNTTMAISGLVGPQE